MSRALGLVSPPRADDGVYEWWRVSTYFGTLDVHTVNSVQQSFLPVLKHVAYIVAAHDCPPKLSVKVMKSTGKPHLVSQNRHLSASHVSSMSRALSSPSTLAFKKKKKKDTRSPWPEPWLYSCTREEEGKNGTERVVRPPRPAKIWLPFFVAPRANQTQQFRLR